MKSITKIKFTLLLLFIVLIKQLPAQSFSCPPAFQVINSSSTCSIRINYQITCPSPCSTLTCASGTNILIPATGIINLPCPACLGSCSGCDVTVVLIQVAAFPISPIHVDSINTTASSVAACCNPLSATLTWTSANVRFNCQ